MKLTPEQLQRFDDEGYLSSVRRDLHRLKLAQGDDVVRSE
jgi:hypothetical protein